MVGIPDDLKLLFSDIPKDSYSKSRSGNGCLHTMESGRPSSVPTARTSSLKSVFKRLYEFKLHIFWKSAHVVVGLDRLCSLCTAFYDICIQCPLGQPFDIGSLGPVFYFFIKRIDKFVPMIFRFSSGSLTPASLDKKRSLASTLTRWMFISRPKVSMTLSASPLRSRPWSMNIQISWSPMAFVQERGHDTGIHAAAQSKKYFI